MEKPIAPENIRSKGDLYKYFNMRGPVVRSWLKDLGFDLDTWKPHTLPPVIVKKCLKLLDEK